MKALFVGLGSIGQRHLRNLRQLKGASLDIIAYRQRRTGPMLDNENNVINDRTIVEKYGVREVDSLDVALSEKPDVVFVTNPSSMHVEVAIKAAKSGCHLFIEKPLGIERSGVEELARLVDQKQLVVLVAYQLRFHPGLQKINNWLRKRRIGRLVSAHIVNGEYLPQFHVYEDYRIGYAAQKKLGGGCLFTQIHEFDYIYSLFGKPRRMFSVGGKISDLEIDVEDAVSLLMEYKFSDGIFPVTLCLDFIQLPPERTCTIIGTEGRIVWNIGKGDLRLVTRGEVEDTEIYDFSHLDRNDLFIKELDHFLDCVSNKSHTVVDIYSGAGSLDMALAAHKSLETGEIQSL